MSNTEKFRGAALRWKGIICLVFACAGAVETWALDPARSIYQYSCRSWFRQNGLPANGITAIVQSPDGYLWLGTSMGLVRFDGSAFELIDMTKVSEMRSTIVTSLAHSRGGGLWVGFGYGSFGYFDGQELSFRGRPEWGSLGLNVHSLVESRSGDLWIAAETQLTQISPTKGYKAFLTGGEAGDRYDVTAIFESASGRIWIGTSRRGLLYWEDGELSRLESSQLEQITIRAIVEDSKGDLWVGTDSGLLCFDRDLQPKPMPFPWFETRTLLADRHGAVWAGMTGAGVARFQDGVVSTFSRSNGLADDFVTSLAEDREGSIWIGTRNGLSQLADVKIPTLGKAEGLTAEANLAVCSSQKGGVWIAGTDRITYFDGQAHAYFSTNLGLANWYVKALFEATNGDLYVSSGNMHVEVVSNSKVIARYANSAWPMAFTESAQGVIAGVGGELFRVGPDYYEQYTFANNERPSFGWIWSLVTDADGSFWVASDNGICHVAGDKFRMWTSSAGLPEGRIMWICRDNEGVIWAGSEMGITRLKDGKARTITRDDGLFDNLIYAIVPDDFGYLWVDSSRGVFKVSRRNLHAFCDDLTETVQCVAYDGLDAVRTDEKAQFMQSGCRTLDGRIWFPTVEGLLMINPTNISVNPVPPRVHIQAVRANGRVLDLSTDAIVPPGSGELEFQYAGLSFIAPQKVRYQYQLEGYDAKWVDAGGRRSAFYTNLKPGRYVFHVKACNEDGIWSASPKSYQVRLEPYPYQTVGFRITMVLGVLGILAGGITWRVNHLKRKQVQLQFANDLLERRVRERTTELARSNSSLQKEIDERKRVQGEVERIHRQLMDASRQAGQAEVASSVLHNVGNVLNSVNVSANILADRLGSMRLPNLARVANLVHSHRSDLQKFLQEDRRGQHVPEYLIQLSTQLNSEQGALLAELKQLTENIDHIKEIVKMQQTYAKVVGLRERLPVVDLVESALKMNMAAYERHGVSLQRDFEKVPEVTVDKHKVLQILVNVLRNAKYACDGSQDPNKLVIVRVRHVQDAVRIEVIDNGVGIAPENLTRIFSHGFTTRRNGHGFGLHSSALAARDLGAQLTVHSDGLGCGATFALTLPLQPPE